MWIIPNNHPLYSVFAPEAVVSKEDLKEHLADLVGSSLQPQLMWRSKPLLRGIWLGKWKKVYWLQHLYGRILKPSIQNHFEESLTSYLQATHASRSVWPEKEMGQKTQDTFGRIYSDLFRQQDLFGASLKTSQGTCHWDMEKFIEAYGIWVTQLRQDCLRRRKLARLTKESGCSSSHWTTPMSSDLNRTTKFQQGGTPLNLQVNWPTPRASANENRTTKNAPSHGKTHGKTLAGEVQSWPTPVVMMCKGSSQNAQTRRDGSSRTNDRLDHKDFVIETVNGPQDREKNNTIGSDRVLSPAWVFQLMGTTIEKTFCEWQEMPSLNKSQS